MYANAADAKIEGVNVPAPPIIHPLLLLDELLLSHSNQITRIVLEPTPTVSTLGNDRNIDTTAPANPSTPTSNVINATDTTYTGITIPAIPANRYRNNDNDRERFTYATSSAQRTFQILKGADFICSKAILNGGSSSLSALPSLSSLLECALEILDDHSGSSGADIQDDESPIHDREKISAPVRLIRAVDSGRSFLIVQHGGRTKKRRRTKRKFIHGVSDDDEVDVDMTEYICLIGNTSHRRKKEPDQPSSDEMKRSYSMPSSSSIAAGRIGFHCSCRSFFERLKLDRFAVCEHLIAARLAPFLQGGNYQEDNVSEEEFAKLFLKHSLF